MDSKTRKLVTINGGLCIPRSDEGRGLVSVEDCVKEEKCNLANYAAQSK